MDPHHITHGESLWERLDVLRDKGSHGAKTCLAMGTFLRESAAVENTYGKALIKAAERRVVKPQNSALGVGWAPSLMQQGWAGVVSAVSSWGKQHVGWALCVDQNISKSLTQFAARHGRHVEDLWTEAQDLVSDLEVVQGEYYRAKGAYERACIDATRLLDERNKARENAAAATEHGSGGPTRNVPLSADTPNKAVGMATSPSKEGQGGSMLSSMSKMFEKVSEGMAMAVAIAAGDLTLEELEEKVPALLQKVDVTESEYIASIMAVNGYTTEFQPELEAKLKQFQLLEESRIMHIREALLRLDQATRGMLDCLLGPGGTLEALSAALSRVDIVGDLKSQIALVREQVGLPSIPCAKRVTCKESMDEKRDGADEAGKHESLATSAPRSGADSDADSSWQMVGVHESQRATGIAILDLGEEELTKAFEGTRDVATECARCVQEMISCLEEVVAVQENHARDLLRLLARQGYGDRVSESEVTGSRGSTRVVADFHAIGATMEDVGKNVVANMSGTASSSSICAKAVAGEGKTLMEGWESSAVAKAVVNLEAHSRLAHVLANDFGSVAGKVHEEAKMSIALASKSFAASTKQVGAAKAAHSKTVSRYEKVNRELREKQDTLVKARVDLKAEIQASTAFPSEPAPSTPQAWSATAVVSPNASTTSAGDPSNLPSSPISKTGIRPRLTNQQMTDLSAESDSPMDGLGSEVHSGDVSGMRRDSPSVLETLGLSQGAWNRMRALELRLNNLNHEGSTAKQAVEDAVQGLEAALSGLGQTTRDICLAVLAEEESRHQHVTQMLDGVLAALLNTAQVFNEEQRRADESESTRNIDGQRDIEELVNRNARSPPPPGVGSRARSGQNDGVGEVMFMAYHSEVLQRERDLRRRTHLSSASAASGSWSPVENAGVRQAGGGGHLFTAMAEAALAQAHAKRQQRQAYAKRQQLRQYSEGGQLAGGNSPRTSASRIRPPSVSKSSEDCSRPCVSDSEILFSNRQRSRRRHRHASRRREQSLEHTSDSELMGFDENLSRHGGGSFHGVRRRGSRQSSRHGSTPSSRQSSFRVLRPDTVPPIIGCGGSQTSGESSQDMDQKVLGVSQTHPADVEGSEQSSRIAPVTGQLGYVFDAEPSLVETSALAYPKQGDDVGVDVDVDVEVVGPCSVSLSVEGTRGDDHEQDEHRKHGGDDSREERMQSEGAPACESEAQEPSVHPVLISRPFAGEQDSSEREDHPARSTREEAPAGDKAGTSSATRAHPQVDPQTDPQADFHADSRPYDEVEVEHENEREREHEREHGYEHEPIGEKMTPVDDRGAGSDPREQTQGAMSGEVENERSGTEIYTPDTGYPTEELGFHGLRGHGGYPTEELGTDNSVEIAKVHRPTGTRSMGHGKGRPSLRSLRHRVTHQDDGFSSCGEVEELSSTDDDRLSERSTEVSPGVDKMRALDRGSPRQYPPGRTVEGHGADVPDKEATLSRGIEPSPGGKVIESYSCALYGGGLPLHGRLSITASSARFSGWRNTKIVLPLSDIAAVEKTSTLGIVPNALTFVRRSGDKVTLGSFLFRDDCHALLMKLVMVASSISMLDEPLSTSESFTRGTTAVAGTRDARDSSPGDEVHRTTAAESLSEPSESDPGVAVHVHGRLADLDGNGSESLDVMVDENLPCTVAQAFTWLWGEHSDVWPDFMKDQGEVDLQISRWQMLTPSREKSLASSGASAVGFLGGLFPGEKFEAQRELTFTHPRSGLVVGPKKVLTRQIQAYRVERRRNASSPEQRGTAAPMDRALVFQTTRMERAPLADYFTILGRVVLSRQPPLKASDGAFQPWCRLQISFDVVFHKSTVLQRAIRSGASDESRATWKAWLEAALKVVAYQQQVLGRAQSVAGVSASPPPGVLTLASRPMAGEDAENRSPIGQDVKRTANTAIHDTSTLDKEQDAGVWSVVVSVAHSVRAVSFDAIASSRITLGLTFLCLLVIVIQQISIWRLARQVENLTLAVNHLQKRLG